MASRRRVLKFAAGGGAILFARQAGKAGGQFAPAHELSPGEQTPPGSPAAIGPVASPAEGRALVPALAKSGIAPPPPPPAATPTPVPVDTRHEAPLVFGRGDPSAKVVYLTMDDDYATGAVADAMEVAEQYGAHLTFFPYAQVMSKSPGLWREVRRRGHAIENHTFSHKQLPGLSDAALYEEMEGWNRVAREVLDPDYSAAFFRPPGGAGVYGERDERIFKTAAELGMKIAMWSSDSEGWRTPEASDPVSVAAVAANALANFGPGSVVLQHAVRCDVLALPSILEEAKRQGLACKTLREGIR